MERYFPLRDLSVRSEAGRRYIDAYAAVYGVRQEIRDREGHYLEVLAPGSFDRTIEQRRDAMQVLFNHGMTVHGTPSDRWTSPIGLPVDMRSDEIGLWTVTEVARTDAAEEVLQLVEDGIVRGMSFSGSFVSTDETKATRTELAVKLRTEVSMREYGPTPFPAYSAARIVAARAELEQFSPEELREYLASLPADVRADLARHLSPAAPRTAPADPAAPRTASGDPHTPRARALALLSLEEA